MSREFGCPCYKIANSVFLRSVTSMLPRAEIAAIRQALIEARLLDKSTRDAA